MKYKKIVGNGIFVSCCCALGYYTFFGHNSLYEYFKQKQQCSVERQRIAGIKADINRLERLEDSRKKNPEALEQYARLDLCLGRTNELVYLLPKKKA